MPDAARAVSFVPSIRIFTERLVVGEGDALCPTYGEQEVPVFRLLFDYGGMVLRSSDERQAFFLGREGAVARVERDLAGEARAQRLLESFGCIELSCVPEYGLDNDSEADYLVQADGNVHKWCSFTAYAVPQLRALGWNVEFDTNYPYRVVEGEAPWYASVNDAPEEQPPDWFSL